MWCTIFWKYVLKILNIYYNINIMKKNSLHLRGKWRCGWSPSLLRYPEKGTCGLKYLTEEKLSLRGFINSMQRRVTWVNFLDTPLKSKEQSLKIQILKYFYGLLKVLYELRLYFFFVVVAINCLHRKIRNTENKVMVKNKSINQKVK